MMIRYWHPGIEIENVRRQLDKMFDQFALNAQNTPSTWQPAIELIDAGDNLILKAQLPGIEGKDVEIQVTQKAVAIVGEYRTEQREGARQLHSEFRYGKFQGVLQLPYPIQNDQVKVDFTNGILTLTLPKVVEVRNKVVKINLGETAPEAAN
ncbi:Hsp20/alpha crystallin family protein [Microseira wollei]|uniref:Heat shock protein Hsp20 n=1 Tax=Microseira wollei NIES-4236 TaxID=2530354 RepID=A0AAV3X9I1_9CYAN|nr:Hsp20/alpha crystallin family protein [Microseira wollei]GET39482.1 heat shock protein Hsp20 [Microseira wollei NIES-4236]